MMDLKIAQGAGHRGEKREVRREKRENRSECMFFAALC
jgi:hypothetical protein